MEFAKETDTIYTCSRLNCGKHIATNEDVYTFRMFNWLFCEKCSQVIMKSTRNWRQQNNALNGWKKRKRQKKIRDIVAKVEYERK